MRELFDCEVGLSDHTMGIGAAVAAVALGATVIEKHFTLDRKDGGVDAAFSLEPAEMTALVRETERAWQALGSVSYGPTDPEKNSLVFRRSLYITKDLMAGDKLTRENVRAIRPGYGLPPKYLDVILGKKVNRDVQRGTPLEWDIL
jgi:N-acetylneuraminate synthase